MKALNITALVLLIIGGINWGLVGFFDYNLVDEIFQAGSVMARTIYAIVGVAALWSVFGASAMMSDKKTM
ncbi:MAG: DUF378 domain-containing protein [Candidatus Saccharimonadales bacterium]